MLLLLDLYEAGFEVKYLKLAIHYNKILLKDFWDEENKGLFFTDQRFKTIFSSQKEVYDGAIPSGNSIVALNFIRLAKISQSQELLKKAEETFQAFYSQIDRRPSAFCQMMIAMELFTGSVKEIVIAGDIQQAKEFIDIVFSRFLPAKIVLFKPLDKKLAKEIVAVLPYLEDQVSIDNKPTVYVCENYTCQAPATNKEMLEKILEGKK